MAQSKTSLKYVTYIKQAKSYMQDINAMAQGESISDAQRAKMRLMAEVVVDSYKKLAPSVITDSKLVEEAALYNEKFEKLLEKVNR
jgi:hypothetical protein